MLMTCLALAFIIYIIFITAACISDPLIIDSGLINVKDSSRINNSTAFLDRFNVPHIVVMNHGTITVVVMNNSYSDRRLRLMYIMHAILSSMHL